MLDIPPVNKPLTITTGKIITDYDDTKIYKNVKMKYDGTRPLSIDIPKKMSALSNDVRFATMSALEPYASKNYVSCMHVSNFKNDARYTSMNTLSAYVSKNYLSNLGISNFRNDAKYISMNALEPYATKNYVSSLDVSYFNNDIGYVVSDDVLKQIECNIAPIQNDIAELSVKAALSVQAAYDVLAKAILLNSGKIAIISGSIDSKDLIIKSYIDKNCINKNVNNAINSKNWNIRYHEYGTGFCLDTEGISFEKKADCKCHQIKTAALSDNELKLADIFKDCSMTTVYKNGSIVSVYENKDKHSLEEQYHDCDERHHEHKTVGVYEFPKRDGTFVIATVDLIEAYEKKIESLESRILALESKLSEM